MDEQNQENEQNEQELPDQAIHQGTQMAANAAKKQVDHQIQAQKAKLAQILAKIIAWAVAHIIPIIIAIVIIVAGIFLFSAFDGYMDEDTSQTVDEVAFHILDDYCTLDDTGIHFNKEGFLKAIIPELAQNGIDLNGLGLRR